ncbi:MAG: ATP-binding cassette domain-containing protein, partial [Pseudolabrys sp.]
MTTPMLSVEGVSHSYGGRRALDNVTFAVAPATFSVMLGLNGAGKSTLFALITRLYGTQHGRIRILDFDVARVSGEALRILGVVFE